MLLLSTSPVKILKTTEEFFRNYGRKSWRLYLFIHYLGFNLKRGKVHTNEYFEWVHIKFMESKNQLQISQYCSDVTDNILPSIKVFPDLCKHWMIDSIFKQYKNKSQIHYLPLSMYVQKKSGKIRIWEFSLRIFKTKSKNGIVNFRIGRWILWITHI